MKHTDKAMRVLAQLGHGPENALVARDLIAILRRQGISVSDRFIRMVAEESDLPVATGDFGYFIATEPGHLRETVGRLRSQGIRMLGRADRLEDWQRRLATPVVQQLSFLEGAA